MAPDVMGRRARSLVSCLYVTPSQSQYSKLNALAEHIRHKDVEESIRRRGMTQKHCPVGNAQEKAKKKNIKGKLRTGTAKSQASTKLQPNFGLDMEPPERTQSIHGIFTGLLTSLDKQVIVSPKRIRTKRLCKEIPLSQIILNTPSSHSGTHSYLKLVDDSRLMSHKSSFLVSLSFGDVTHSDTNTSITTAPAVRIFQYNSVFLPVTPELLVATEGKVQSDAYPYLYSSTEDSENEYFPYSPVSLSSIDE